MTLSLVLTPHGALTLRRDGEPATPEPAHGRGWRQALIKGLSTIDSKLPLPDGLSVKQHRGGHILGPSRFNRRGRVGPAANNSELSIEYWIGTIQAAFVGRSP